MKTDLFLISLLLIFSGLSCSSKIEDPDDWEAVKKTDWTLVWSEEFDGTDIDYTKWKKIIRHNAEWNKHRSDYEELYEVKGGILTMRGIVKPDHIQDTVPFLTGGICTIHYGKGFPFENGLLRIRAKLEWAQSVWPALWLLPHQQHYKWPDDGEIDIMELVDNATISQTVHTLYTVVDKKTENPPHAANLSINEDDFNIYGVELCDDRIIFSVNDRVTHIYPLVEAEDEARQFPFRKTNSWFLLMDMQLGASWMPPINEEDLPKSMYIDWVRFYKKK